MNCPCRKFKACVLENINLLFSGRLRCDREANEHNGYDERQSHDGLPPSYSTRARAAGLSVGAKLKPSISCQSSELQTISGVTLITLTFHTHQ